MGEWVWIQNVVRENDKFVAEVQFSYGGLPEKVPLTKKLIKRAIKSMVVRLDLFEVMINNKVDDFDNFVKAAFVANENFSKYEFPLFRSCVEELPPAPDTEDEEALSKWDKQVVEARLKFVAKVESELPRKPLTADQIYEKVGIDEIGKVWDEVSERWDWTLAEFLQFTDSNCVEAKDFIMNTSKLKRTVIGMIMIDVLDDMTPQLGGKCFGYHLDCPLTLEEILALPEE
ncbi:hypothetical protein F3B35_21705 [Bacteroides intestinalis]|jgi:hypothetical protein|nr:hypothetical protein F3B35_21705 [Bacteroides intestinalis]